MDSPGYNLRRSDKVFRSLPKQHLLELAREGLLLPTDQVTDLRDGRTAAAIDEFPGWFSGAPVRRIESVDVLEERVARLRASAASKAVPPPVAATGSRSISDAELLHELRAIRSECAKTKWAVRAVGFIIVGVILGVYTVP